MKGKGKKERYTHLNAEFQRIARIDKKAFLSDQCKDVEENNRMGMSFLFRLPLDFICSMKFLCTLTKKQK